jgi:hypothetical protein
LSKTGNNRRRINFRSHFINKYNCTKVKKKRRKKSSKN